MKKTAFLLALILALTTFLTSCESGNETTTSKIISESNGESSEYSLDSVPDMDYGEKEFGVFGVRGSMDFLIAEEENGDIVNDAVFRRNGTIEDRYNLIFNMYVAPPNVGTDMIKNLVLSADTTYKFYQGLQHSGMPEMILDNYFVDWNLMDAVHYDKPYWNTNVATDINFGGKVYVMSGDLNIITYNSTNCIAFNQALFDDLGIDYPYQLVYDKEWTFDKFIEIVRQGYSDLDGDTFVNVENDRMGFAGWSAEMNEALYIGLGGQVLVNDENNMPVLAINNERTAKLYDCVVELFDRKNAYNNTSDFTIHGKMFDDGRLLMKDDFISCVARNRDSEFKIGVVPYPMLDKQQGEYRSRAANIAHLTYVPTTNKELEETGIVLEAMSIESYNTIRPVYYDTTLDLKSAPDEETKDMVDLILSTATYQWQGFGVGAFVTSVASTRTNKFASWYARNENKFKDLESRIAEFYGA